MFKFVQAIMPSQGRGRGPLGDIIVHLARSGKTEMPGKYIAKASPIH